ncbi:MAG: hypothetical protein QF583_00255 [Rhodospirillales bacterium]|jgi:hypothetical protein|nr:hypothetical protein [Rhodospirillales bacterium]
MAAKASGRLLREPSQPFSGNAAAPPYRYRHSGPVLVCGNAWCLDEDFAAARAIRPGAAVIAVNGASARVKADFLYSYHFMNFRRKGWLARQAGNLGPCRQAGNLGPCRFSVHSTAAKSEAEQASRAHSAPWVDYWWREARGQGTSAWCAVKLARLLGFDEIILCGVPLAPGPYADGRMARDFNRPRILERYRAGIAGDQAWHEGVASMSGWTRDFFGEPRR